MTDIWDFSPLMIAAQKAYDAGMTHTGIIEDLNNTRVQAEQEINNSRAAAIYSFNSANLLYRLAAKEFIKIDKQVYSNNAYTKANDMKIKAEELNSQQRQKEVLDNPPIELSLNRILRPPTTTNLEHQVASWASTMAIQVFEKVKNDKGLSQWIFTPEQRDEESGKIPDLVLEQVFQEPDGELYAKPWLCMEFKKLGGAAPYKALHQVATAVKGKLNEITNTDVLTIYLVVVVGTKISFWEMDFEAIDGRQPEQDVHSLWGCRSLLQSGVKYNGVDYEGEEPPYSTDKKNIPRGVKKLLVRRAVKKSDPQRNQAERYDSPAIFNFSKDEHKGPIREMFEHMARYPPRGF
jgi:hypothetical protein